MNKNLFILIVSALLIGFFAAPVFAVDCDGDFAECDTIPDTNGGGAGITGLQFSPSVQFAYNGADNAYAMGTFNTKGKKTYGVTESYSGIWQTKADATSATAIPGASAEWASDTWTEVAK